MIDLVNKTHWWGELVGWRDKLVPFHLYSSDFGQWSIYGHCFACGEILYVLEKYPKVLSLRLLGERKLNENYIEFDKILLDPPADVVFRDVKWKGVGHTCETTSACSGRGYFEAGWCEIDQDGEKVQVYFRGEPGYGEGI